jgi:hypothetical protein
MKFQAVLKNICLKSDQVTDSSQFSELTGWHLEIKESILGATYWREFQTFVYRDMN